jgi:exosortase
LRFLPAFVVLAFLVVVPGQLRQDVGQYLQVWTARICAALFNVVGIDVAVSGNALTVNGQDVLIAEACNGMRLVFPLILIGFAFCFGLPLRQETRIGLLLLTPFICLVCNVVRTLPVIYLIGQYGRDHALPTLVHDIGGWLMLPAAFGILYAVIMLLRWAALPVDRYRLAART